MLAMDSKSYTLPSIMPHDTKRAALYSFNEENRYIKTGDALDSILQGVDPSIFEYPLPRIPVPAYVFALITIFQRREKLTDADMAEAVRSRPEVRYALRLSLRHPNVPVASLCRYRQLHYNDQVSLEAFKQLSNRMVEMFEGELGFIEDIRCTVSESVCLRNRTNSIITRMLEALEALTATYPDWMRKVVPTYWYDRYHRSATKFIKMTLDRKTNEMILAIGNDMKYILQLAEQEKRIAELSEVEALDEVFHENFEVIREGKIHWKATMCSADLKNILQKMDWK